MFVLGAGNRIGHKYSQKKPPTPENGIGGFFVFLPETRQNHFMASFNWDSRSFTSALAGSMP